MDAGFRPHEAYSSLMKNKAFRLRAERLVFIAWEPTYPLRAAWAAARRAIGTRYGLQET